MEKIDGDKSGRENWAEGDEDENKREFEDIPEVTSLSPDKNCCSQRPSLRPRPQMRLQSAEAITMARAVLDGEPFLQQSRAAPPRPRRRRRIASMRLSPTTQRACRLQQRQPSSKRRNQPQMQSRHHPSSMPHKSTRRPQHRRRRLPRLPSRVYGALVR